MSEKKKEDVKETIQLGDQVFDLDSVTPSTYFNYVKGLKKKVEYEEYDQLISTTMKMLKKTTLTGQTAMAKELTHHLELALRELDAAKDGFDIFVDRKDVEKYINNVEGKAVKIIEIENYEREIPDDIIDKIELARKHFDQLYIFFTDYTKKETKKVAKARRDKDPVMFGAFHDTGVNTDTTVYLEDRLFFIADWVEDKCDLTLEEIVRDVKDKDGKDIIYRVANPEDEEAVKKILNSYKHPLKETELTPVSGFFDKIKRKVTRPKHSTDREASSTPKRRGRRKKEADDE